MLFGAAWLFKCIVGAGLRTSAALDIVAQTRCNTRRNKKSDLFISNNMVDIPFTLKVRNCRSKSVGEVI